MRENVIGMVDRLFENLTMTDEVAALREEVTNNCLERYNDLIAGGADEAEALAAVQESLSGMEEMLSAFPKEEAKPEDGFSPEAFEKPQSASAGPEAFEKKEREEEPNDGFDKTVKWDPSAIHRLDAHLLSTNLTVCRGNGSEIVLERTPDIRCEIQGDTLILRQERYQRQEKDPFTAQNKNDFFSGMMLSLTELLRNTLHGICDVSFARLYVPDGCALTPFVQTASGDVQWTDVPAMEARLQSQSGDITWRTDKSCPLDSIEASTRSGDIDASLIAKKAALSSTSGDVRLNGSANELSVNTVSGDGDLCGHFEKLTGTCISGDLEISLEGPGRGDLRLKTVSGDITVYLRGETRAVRLNTRTVSGDLELNGIVRDDASPIAIQVESVSGDISLIG